MKIITIIRRLMLTAGICSLLFTELLHPVFHNLAVHLEHMQYTGSTYYIVQTDAALNHSAHICPFCSCMPSVCFLDAASILDSRNYQVVALSSPPKYIFSEIIFYSLARAPPAIFS